MKTLVISYLPSKENSNTKKLLDAFLASAKGAEIEHLDLIETPPSFMMPDSLSAYGIRNYGGGTLTPELAAAVAPMDKMVEQFIAADLVVFAYPMHNFGMPGIIKTYYDSILQHGKTFQYGANGPEGLMKGKKALTLYTSGGAYGKDLASLEYPNWNTLAILSRIQLSFMGFSEIELVKAEGTLNPAEGHKENSINTAIEEIKALAQKWNLN